MHVVYVALGGALGAACRHLIGLGVLRWLGPGFPYATLLVNILGSFLMGLLIVALSLKFNGHQEARLFLATGVLGGLTTFSTFSLDVAVLIERGAMVEAGFYIGASVLVSVAALFLAMSFGRFLWGA